MINTTCTTFDADAQAPARYVNVYAQVDKYTRASVIKTWALTELAHGQIVPNTRSRIDEVFAENEGTSYPYGMLDGLWRLEMPYTNNQRLALASQTQGVRGFVSMTATGEGGFFDDLILRYTVNAYRTTTTCELAITWDPKRAEYAESYIVTAYTVDDDSITIADVLSNRSASCVHTLPQLSADIAYIDIRICRWNVKAAGVSAKCISMRVREKYYALTSDDIIAANYTQDSGARDGAIIGTASSGRLSMQINNASGYFAMDNPQGHFYGVKPKELRVRLYCGFEHAAVLVATLYVTEWSSQNWQVSASISAQDIVSVFGAEPYDPSAVAYPCTVADLAEDINNQSGIGVQMSIDIAIANIQIPHIPQWSKTTCREALRLLSEACGASVRATPEGHVVMERRDGNATYTIDGDAVFDIGTPRTLSSALKGAMVDYVMQDGVIDTVTLGVEPRAYVQGNPLIQTADMAHGVAEQIIDGLGSQDRQEIVWRGNPRVEPGDLLCATNRYNKNVTIRVDSQTMHYSGGLRMTSAGYCREGQA